MVARLKALGLTIDIKYGGAVLRSLRTLQIANVELKEPYKLLLPNRENAFIQPAKLTGYLLSETHSVGKSKAKFFREFGFNEENVEILEQELLRVARFQEINETITTTHGTKYTIVGTINTPSGKAVNVITVWIIDANQETPRFVTAGPFLESKGEKADIQLEREIIRGQLLALLDVLPVDLLTQMRDFAEFLQQKYKTKES
ncbi:DUF6883 domain-containing protein [Microseira sp. BLCC-F43]|jgi:hypothetical protein|uniref:DUF6883 domain-containing protein n=1 Tax=Microseira sp. BLCC-F43 TaxID=3153602 RepID=UPI0035B90F0B